MAGTRDSSMVGEARDPYPTDIGVRLRRLRRERKLTIMRLAERAHVSSGMISQIERCTTNPSINTLQRIRAALGVNLWELLENQPSSAAAPVKEPVASSAFVRRKADRPRIVVGRTRLVKELLSPRNDRHLRFMVITLPPGGQSEDVIIGEGEKGGVVTEGRVRLSIGADDSILDDGDSFQFPSNLEHKLSNPFEHQAKVIWIMSVVDTHI